MNSLLWRGKSNVGDVGTGVVVVDLRSSAFFRYFFSFFFFSHFCNAMPEGDPSCGVVPDSQYGNAVLCDLSGGTGVDGNILNSSGSYPSSAGHPSTRTRVSAPFANCPSFSAANRHSQFMRGYAAAYRAAYAEAMYVQRGGEVLQENAKMIESEFETLEPYFKAALDANDFAEAENVIHSVQKNIGIAKDNYTRTFVGRESQIIEGSLLDKYMSDAQKNIRRFELQVAELQDRIVRRQGKGSPYSYEHAKTLECGFVPQLEIFSAFEKFIDGFCTTPESLKKRQDERHITGLRRGEAKNNMFIARAAEAEVINTNNESRALLSQASDAGLFEPEAVEYIKQELAASEHLASTTVDIARLKVSRGAITFFSDMAIGTASSIKAFLVSANEGAAHSIWTTAQVAQAIFNNPTLVTRLSQNIMHTITEGPHAVKAAVVSGFNYAGNAFFEFQLTMAHGSAEEKGRAFGELTGNILVVMATAETVPAASAALSKLASNITGKEVGELVGKSIVQEITTSQKLAPNVAKVDATVERVSDSARRLGIAEADIARVVNKAHHIFGPADIARHKLGGFLEKFSGDQLHAFKSLEEATQTLVSRGEISGIFITTVLVRDTIVTVSGRVIDGVAKIGTAFIP